MLHDWILRAIILTSWTNMDKVCAAFQNQCQRWRFWLELNELHYITVVAWQWKYMTSSRLVANTQHYVWWCGSLNWDKYPTKKDLRFQQSNLTTDQEYDSLSGLDLLLTLSYFYLCRFFQLENVNLKFTEQIRIGTQVCLKDVSCLSYCCVKLTIFTDFLCAKAKQLMFQLVIWAEP